MERCIKKREMINSDDKVETINKIKKIIHLSYLSSYLKNEKPISLLLLAPPEQSKTYFLLAEKTKFCHLSTDLSFIGLVKILQGNNAIKHIIIPDFTKITGKKRSTTENLLTLLNSYLEEGVFGIDLGNREKIDLKGIKGGILTATTEKSFIQNRKNWEGIGFSSRFIVVSWCYSDGTIEQIKKEINKGVKMKTKSKIISCRKTEVTSDEETNSLLNDIAGNSLRKLGQLQVLLKCLALDDGRNKTNSKDVKELIKLNEVLNFNFTKI